VFIIRDRGRDVSNCQLMDTVMDKKVKLLSVKWKPFTPLNGLKTCSETKLSHHHLNIYILHCKCAESILQASCDIHTWILLNGNQGRDFYAKIEDDRIYSNKLQPSIWYSTAGFYILIRDRSMSWISKKRSFGTSSAKAKYWGKLNSVKSFILTRDRI
jgi:hypothetical protein